jgi:hypothetical protein
MHAMKYYFLLALLLIIASSPAHALRCGNRVISDGDRDFQVQDRCGAPFWSDTYYGVDIVDRGGRFERQREVQWTVWYYNFGPNALMQRLVFLDGILRKSETLGYGVREIGTSCNANMSFTGLSSGELVARCGEPASRRQNNDTVVYRPGPRVESWRDQRREEWIYDFGDSRLLRIVQLIDGRVTSVDVSAR